MAVRRSISASRRSDPGVIQLLPSHSRTALRQVSASSLKGMTKRGRSASWFAGRWITWLELQNGQVSVNASRGRDVIAPQFWHSRSLRSSPQP